MKREFWWTRIWKTLANQQGQIPVSDEPLPAEPVSDEPTEPAPGDGGAPVQEDSVFDPSQLAPELQTQWKKMQGAYTKRMQSIAQTKNAAQIVDRFNTDPDFARQTIQQRAQQLGMTLGQPGSQPGLSNGSSKSLPPELVEAVKTNLSPELQWMAPALAASQWAGMQMALQPIQEQQAQSARSTRDQQYDALVEQLSSKAPGWEAHEDDMDGLLSFLQSPKMTDRRWGSKLELLHKLVTGDGQATAEAARRMGQAGRSRAPGGMPMAAPVLNIGEQVKKVKNNSEAWELAAKHAMAELTRQGIKL